MFIGLFFYNLDNMFQAWKDVSAEAKDFIDQVLALDPNERLTASQVTFFLICYAIDCLNSLTDLVVNRQTIIYGLSNEKMGKLLVNKFKRPD